MSVCASGASTIKPTTPAVLALTNEFMEAYLPPDLLFLKPFLPYIRPIIIESVSNFCSIDPPGYPSLTGLTFAAILAGGQVGAGLVIAEAITQTLLNLLWYQLCQCSSGPLPTIPTSPSPPANLPAVNPPAFANPGFADPCGLLEHAAISLASPGSKDFYGTNSPLAYIAPPPGTTLIRAVVTMISGAGAHDQGFAYLQSGVIATATGVNTVANNSIPIGTTVNIDLPFAAPATGFRMAGSQQHVTPTTDSMSVRIEFYCGGSTPTAPQPLGSCLPDPIMRGQLAQILNLVSLIQRQHVPFAYLEGTAHSTLTDDGSFSVQGLIGLRVQITTLPDQLGRAAGTPMEVFEAGWLTIGDDSGYQESHRIDQVSRLYFPDAMGAMTLVGYTLAPGVVIRVTELVREP